MNRSYMTVHGLIRSFAGAVASIKPIHERVNDPFAALPRIHRVWHGPVAFGADEPELDILTVRAPRDGTILQVNVRAGAPTNLNLVLMSGSNMSPEQQAKMKQMLAFFEEELEKTGVIGTDFASAVCRPLPQPSRLQRLFSKA